MSCTCPAPCDTCPPLTDDTEADAEYRATTHLFTKTTGRGRNPRPALTGHARPNRSMP